MAISMELKPFKRESLLPLPVTFISTISKAGTRNIAPYSCITTVLRPLDLVCVASAKRRDTLDNIRETGEFVINLPGANLSGKVVPTAKNLPPGEDEFTYAGLEEHPSRSIKASGIKGCYAWMECTLDRLYEEDQYALIIGKVVHLEVNDAVYDGEGHLNVDAACPLMMTGSDVGMHFCTVKEIGHFEPYSAMFTLRKDPLEKMYKR